MILHVSEVRYLDDYRLFVAFDNAEAGEIDLAMELDGEVFEALKDRTIFASANLHPQFKTVFWSNGADMAPEYLLELLHTQHAAI
jgi:hypothetical protein